MSNLMEMTEFSRLGLVPRTCAVHPAQKLQTPLLTKGISYEPFAVSIATTPGCRALQALADADHSHIPNAPAIQRVGAIGSESNSWVWQPAVGYFYLPAEF